MILSAGFDSGMRSSSRVLQDLRGKFPDLLWHCGGKKQGLPLRGEHVDDLHDVVVKSHVEHPVCLIEDQVLQGR